MRFGLEDVAPLLKWLTDQHAPSVLVGGLAIGAWARLLLPGVAAIQSKDVDFRGPRFLAAAIQQWGIANGMRTGQIVKATRKNAPEAGKIFNFPLTPDRPDAVFRDELVIEVLERLPLLDGSVSEPPKGSVLIIDDMRLLDPMSLMICKLHAYHTRPPEHQINDRDHLNLLCRIIPAFLSSEVPRHPGYNPQPDIDRLCHVLEVPAWNLPIDGEPRRLLFDSLRTH